MTLKEYIEAIKNLPPGSFFERKETMRRLYEQYQSLQDTSIQEFLRTPIEQVMYGNNNFSGFLHFVNHIGPLQIAAIMGGLIVIGCWIAIIKRRWLDFMTDRMATLVFLVGIGIIFAVGVLL